jgi:hypothetical protein
MLLAPSCLLTARSPEHEVILLHQRKPGRARESPKFHLSPPLTADKQIKLGHGATISGVDLIGRNILDVVKDSTGREVHLREAGIPSYVLLGRRDAGATPVRTRTRYLSRP